MISKVESYQKICATTDVNTVLAPLLETCHGAAGFTGWTRLRGLAHRFLVNVGMVGFFAEKGRREGAEDASEKSSHAVEVCVARLRSCEMRCLSLCPSEVMI